MLGKLKLKEEEVKFWNVLLRQSYLNGEQVYVDSGACGSCKDSGGNSANLVGACLFLEDMQYLQRRV